MAGEKKKKKKFTPLNGGACKKFMDKLLGTLLCSLGPNVHEPKEKKKKSSDGNLSSVLQQRNHLLPPGVAGQRNRKVDVLEIVCPNWPISPHF